MVKKNLLFLFLFPLLVCAEESDRFIQACLSATDMGMPVCDCIAGRAQKELTPKGYEFIIATLNKDKKNAESLRWHMKEDEFNDAGSFMAHTPMQCAEETGEHN